MIGRLYKLLGLALLIITSSAGIWIYINYTSNEREKARLEEKNRVLTQVIQRLSDEKRVAQVAVADQKTINGVLHSTLLFAEDDKSGNSMPPRKFEVIGTMAHIDAMVVKFEREFVKEGDGLRGHSIALFTQIYGDRQTPATGAPIDLPGHIPAIYRTADPRTTEFELDLWQQFWRLADDEGYRKQYGVRIANGQGLWWPIQLEKLYTITIESDGGLNYTSEPIKPIFLEMLKNKVASSSMPS
jgi:hypothetical protein